MRADCDINVAKACLNYSDMSENKWGIEEDDSTIHIHRFLPSVKYNIEFKYGECTDNFDFHSN